jgi:hypothetical protein
MAEQADNSAKPPECNIGIYPYDCIRLELKKLLSRFGSKLGIDFVPLVFQRGTKGGGKFASKWTTKTWEELSSVEGYLKALTGGEWNIGIRLGPKSGKNSSFDIDTENRVVIDTLLKYKPELADTLWTKSPNQKSGANIWFKQRGDWAGWTLGKHAISVPGISGKKDEACLEFRTQDGLQNIIWGTHEAGGEYYVANDKPILEFDFADFKPLFAATKELGWAGWPELITNRTGRDEGRWYNNPLSWKGKFETRCQIIESLGFEIVDVDETTGKVAVICVNEAEHSRDSGEWQTVIFTGTDSSGKPPKYFCPHSHCKTPDEDTGFSINRLQTQRIIQAFAEVETIFYRIGNERIHETYSVAYQKMRECGQFYSLNKTLIKWRMGLSEIVEINANRLQVALNEMDISITQELAKGKIRAYKLAGQDANSMIDQPELVESLNHLKFVTPVPLLYWNKDAKVAGATSYGYNPGLECLCLSQEPITPWPIKKSVEFLSQHLLDFWKYDTPEDRSRALMMVISINLCLGNWYEDKGAYHLVIADRSGAGKTFLVKCIGAIYGMDVTFQDFENKSIGGISERFDRALAEGRFIFAIDNIRGEFDIAKFESAATGGNQMDLRLAYGKHMSATLGRMTLFFTGNEGFKMTRDMSYRLNITKVLHTGVPFTEENGESLITMIKTNGPLYRSALSGILAEYARKGCPRRKLTPNEAISCDLRFVDWTEVCNGILSMLSLPLLTTGLAERQLRVSDPTILFADEAFGVLKTKQMLDQEGIAETFAKIFEDEGMELPIRSKNPRISDRAKAMAVGKAFRSLPVIKKDQVNRFGAGYVHIFFDSKNKQYTYAISESREPKSGLPILEYDA